MGKGKDDNLWDLGIEQNKEKGDGDKKDEKSVFVLGGKSAGKTTLILRFLDRDEPAKPTTALEYTFGRKGKGPNAVKDVGHIWELGGGVSFSKLIDVPLNSHNILSMSAVLVLDLSAPEEMWSTLETLLYSLSTRVEQCLTECARRDNQLFDKIKNNLNERIGADHMDKELMEPFKIPLAIIGTKFDQFQALDPEKRKVIAKTLRFVAHMYGASLMFTTMKIESTISKFRGLVGSLLFGTAQTQNKQSQLDHTKPLLISAGSDSMQSIGSPAIDDDDIGSVSARNPLELWKHVFCKHFPQTSNKDKTTDDHSKHIQFSEPVIDKIRLEKDEELERYRKTCERKMRDLENQAQQDGII